MSSATFDNVVKNVKDIMLSIVNINPYNDATSEMDFKTMLIIKDFLFEDIVNTETTDARPNRKYTKKVNGLFKDASYN